MKFRKFVYSLLFTSGIYAAEAERRSNISSSQNHRVVPFENGASVCRLSPEVMQHKADQVLSLSTQRLSRQSQDNVVSCIASLPKNLIFRNCAVLMMLNQRPLFPNTPINCDDTYEDGFLFDDSEMLYIKNQFLDQLIKQEGDIEVGLADLLIKKSRNEDLCSRLQMQKDTLEIGATGTKTEECKRLEIEKEHTRLYDLAIQKQSILLAAVRRKIDGEKKAEKDFVERYQALSQRDILKTHVEQRIKFDKERKSFVDVGQFERKIIISDENYNWSVLCSQFARDLCQYDQPFSLNIILQPVKPIIPKMQPHGHPVIPPTIPAAPLKRTPAEEKARKKRIQQLLRL